MDIKVALAGNPNCGKTTLFNSLTGSKQHVGNWPGVTVDKKDGVYKKNKDVKILDLPGIYSLSPYSAEEIVARDYIVKEKPDVVINIVDGTSIERNLYLTLQVLETRIPTVVAVNMMDEVEARGDSIDCKKLSKALGVPVVPIVARNGKGVEELVNRAVETAKAKQKAADLDVFPKEIQNAVTEIEKITDGSDPDAKRWNAIKLVEGDEIVTEQLPSAVKGAVDQVLTNLKKDVSDPEATIADERYKFIGKVVKQAVKKKSAGHTETVSDKLDKILTNRILALPVFVLVMYLIFSITFGESLFGFDVPGPGAALQGLVEDSWDEVLTEGVEGLLDDAGASEWLVSLVADGILAGVGGVVSFLPQILILFLLLSFLEDTGYMARVAFVMDRIFRKFGLTGKSFIPLLMGFGCSVPALMASRTLENDKDRKLTMMITPFMSCGAKLPIYLMFAAALFTDGDRTWLMLSIYFLGIAVAILSGIILSKTMFKGVSADFIMELPQYRWPTIKSILIHGWEKVKGFAIRAGTIIFASTVLIWFLSHMSFGFQFLPDEEMELSILAAIGKALRFIFIPLGFGNDWRPVVGTITGFIAKENIVATFGVLFEASDEIIELAEEGEAALPGIKDIFTNVSAYSYMAFNLLCMPCFAAVGALKKEMGSWKWTLKAVGFQMAVAYVVALVINVVGSLIF